MVSFAGIHCHRWDFAIFDRPSDQILARSVMTIHSAEFHCFQRRKDNFAWFWKPATSSTPFRQQLMRQNPRPVVGPSAATAIPALGDKERGRNYSVSTAVFEMAAPLYRQFVMCELLRLCQPDP